MATLQIENLPDELYGRIQSLAAEHNFTFNEAVIHLLQQASQFDQINIVQAQPKKLMSEVLHDIRSRPRVNPINFGLMDSTVLVREDSDLYKLFSAPSHPKQHLRYAKG